MKLFIIMLLSSYVLYAATIDTKLYENTENEAYYTEIQKQIESDEKSKLKSLEISEEEKLHLSRVRSASSQKNQIELYDLKSVSKKPLTFNNYYYAINAAASVRVKQNLNRKMLREVNKKSIFLKQAIENIVEADKPKLLSYQLQYAYYKLQEKNIEAKQKLLDAHEEEIISTLFNVFSLLECDFDSDIDIKMKLTDKEIEKISLEKISLEIDLEKALIEDSAKIERIKKKIQSYEAQYQEQLNKKIMLQIEQSLCMLKNKRSKTFFKLIDGIEIHIKEVSTEFFPVYVEEFKILREIAKEVLGSTKLFFSSTLYESREILSQIKGYFTSPLFVFNEQPISLSSLIKAIILIIFGLIVGRFYKRWVARISRKWPDMSQMSVRLASNIGYYLIIAISFIVAMGSLGIDMTSISLIAGALSIGIGFGLQTVVSNLIAGIILMFERTIRIGDTIEINDTMRGRVTDMRIRSTTIKTFDNIDIVIPNSSFIQNNVINWTLDDISRRVHIPFGVAYGTDVDIVKKVILDELENCNLTYIRDDINKKPEVWMIAMNSSSVDFELLVWVDWDNKFRPNSLKSDFLILIYNTLNKNGIQIPFPQLDLHVRHMPL
ncbi:mechanosensitive ion channel family protein [Candidatus Sulfurimonas baltica]|uniref:Mechanosensitive ion channel n=1 Tax=Candidatus Sulfurimonas baltica TaxID=2740404 RepID=A0A7S7RP09_9BACT|nr:mechanosensitive ion channel domain-containing protein [Candidatus Sulfurimonas baltica]QOY52993.1 mechanosensitive ion channel [Candidatus Sulfurimonas baltica]